jgi:hypothetical protein
MLRETLQLQRLLFVSSLLFTIWPIGNTWSLRCDNFLQLLEIFSCPRLFGAG